MIKLLRTFNGGPGIGVTPLAHDGCSALINTADHVETRNVETGELVASYPATRARLVSGPQNRLIASIYKNGSTLIKDLITGKKIYDIPGEPLSIITMPADGRCLGIGRCRSTGFDSEYYSSFTAEICSLSEGVAYWSKQGSGDSSGGLMAIVISDDSRFAAVISFKSLILINLPEGRTIGEWPTRALQPDDLAFTRDSSFLLVNNRPTLEIIDLASLQIREFAAPPPGKFLSALVVSPDGAKVLAGGSGWCGMWELNSGKLLWEKQLSANYSYSAWFLSDKGLIAVTPVMGKIEIISIRNGAAIDSMQAHARPVTAVAESAGGRYFLTTDGNETKVWDLSAAA